MKIRNRLLLLVFTALVPSAVLTLHTDWDMRTRVVNDSTRRMVESAGILANYQYRTLIGTKQVLKNTAESDGDLLDAQKCGPILVRTLRQNPAYMNFGVADLNGKVICSALVQSGTNVGDRAYFKRALAAGDFAAGEYQVGRITGQPSLNFGYPLKDGLGNIQGIIFASLNLNTLNAGFADMNLPQDTVLNMLDGNGTIIGHYPDGSEWIGKPPADKELIRAIGETASMGSLQNGGQLYAFAPLSRELSGFHVVIGTPTADIFGVANEILMRNLFILIGLMILLLTLALWGIDSLVAEQVSRLLKNVRRFAAGNLQARTGLTKKQGELGELGEAFDEMAASLRTALQNAAIFREASESHMASISICRADGGLIYVNPAWQERNGYTPEEVLGRNPSILKSGKTPPEVYKRMWAALSRGRSFATRELVNRRKDGSEYQEEMTISPILENGKPAFFVAMSQDITEHIAVDRAKSEFVSLASHQLRTPPSIIGWYTEMLLSGDIGGLNEKQRQYVWEIRHSNKRMIEIINALLNVSRIETGSFSISPETLDLKQLADQILGDFSPDVLRRVKVIRKYDKAPAAFRGDTILLQIIFQNLISNALKYTPEGGEMEVAIEERGDALMFAVRDSGVGIPQIAQSRIFTKLFRADNAREIDPDGTGLGLYIVKAVTEASGGRVWFKSEEGKGTTFYVTFPLSGMVRQEGSKNLIAVFNTEKAAVK